MPMYFAMHLPDATDQDLIPEPPLIPWCLSEDIIAGLVQNHCLKADEADDPRRVLDAVGMFLKVGLGLLVAQRGAGTKQ